MSKKSTLLLKRVFVELNTRIRRINRQRRGEGLSETRPCEVTLLGQMSLLVDPRASEALSLAQTADLDALLKMDHAVKEEFKKILRAEGLIYDEDSPLIWIPKDAKIRKVIDVGSITIKAIDAESALVSKAVKAPEKNKQLIREAIASEAFPGLVKRLLKNGGKLEDFL